MKSYHELMQLQSWEERLEYLKLYDSVDLHGAWGRQFHLKDRKRWEALRTKIIRRDCGCDMAVPGVEIPRDEVAIVHHINPVTQALYDADDPILYDPDNLILVCGTTHNYIHYNSEPPTPVVERKPGDNCPWKRI